MIVPTVPVLTALWVGFSCDALRAVAPKLIANNGRWPENQSTDLGNNLTHIQEAACQQDRSALALGR